jgi:hypothetical protein
VEKDFLEKTKPITIDFTPMGFSISSNLDLGPKGEGCGGCSGGC